MIKTNKWHPDTCGCQILFEWDSDVEPDDREHSPIETFNGESTVRCNVHKDLSDISELYAVVKAENMAKNISSNQLVNVVQ